MPPLGSDPSIKRIEISRAEFEHQFGFKPEPGTMGMVFCTPEGIPLYEYVFADDLMAGEVALEIAELERMYAL